MVDTRKSDSREQQEAECYIADIIEQMLCCSLERNAKVIIRDRVHIEPDIFSEKEKVIGEIFAHVGALKVGQQHKISQDILKMLLLEKSTNTIYKKIIVVVDDKVEKYLNGKSFVAESIRQFGIEIKRIDLPEELYTMISNAQVRQTMVNA